MALEIDDSVFTRSALPSRPRGAPDGAGLRTIIIGAGEAGRTLARDLRRTPEYGLSPMGFLDDSPLKKVAAGLPVLGRIADLVAVAAAIAADVAIVAILSQAASCTRARRICEHRGRECQVPTVVRRGARARCTDQRPPAAPG